MKINHVYPNHGVAVATHNQASAIIRQTDSAVQLVTLFVEPVHRRLGHATKFLHALGQRFDRLFWLFNFNCPWHRWLVEQCLARGYDNGEFE